MVICPQLSCTLDLFDTSLGDLDLVMVSESESEFLLDIRSNVKLHIYHVQWVTSATLF